MRQIWPLSTKTLKVTFGKTTNALIVVTSVDIFPQVEIKAKLTTDRQTSEWLPEIELMARKNNMFSLEEWKFVDKINHITKEVHEEFSDANPATDLMTYYKNGLRNH